MTHCYLRLNIHKDCDFSPQEFGYLSCISHEDLNNKDELNKLLKENIKTNHIQVGDIEYNDKNMVVNIHVNPI